MGRIIGIDLGTTNSVVAVIEGGDPIVIPSSEGGNLIPSVVAINSKTGERLVGRVARNQAVVNPQSTVSSIKRLIGRQFDDQEMRESVSIALYDEAKAANGDARIMMNGRQYSPPEISAMILQKLKAEAEAYLGETVDQAVITVPAYFDDTQRKATKDAGTIAGLEVRRIINEPTASSLTYGMDKRNEGIIAVYDLGGGTFDISILEVADGFFEVRSTNGDTYLGGDNFDDRIINWLLREFELEHGINLSKDRQALQRLKEAAENAKIELSTTQRTEINLPFITTDGGGAKNLAATLTRDKLESLTDDLLRKTIEPCRLALHDAGLSTGDVDAVVLVGGMTRMPAIQEAVKNFFGIELTKGVNPDEVVALGAAIQAGVISGDVKDILLLDVTPLTLSVDNPNGTTTPVIERNSTIPSKTTRIRTTVVDNQKEVKFLVVQGERPMVTDNRLLGEFTLHKIQRAPRGVPEFELTYDIDADGILHVSARDTKTGSEKAITISGSGGLSDKEVERMTTEAAKYAGRDAERRALAEAADKADWAIYRAEKLLGERKRKLTSNARRQTEKKIEQAQRALKREDTRKLQEATDALKAQLKALDA